MRGRTARGLAAVATIVLLVGACSSKTNTKPSPSGQTTPPTSSSQGTFSSTNANDHGTKNAVSLTTLALELDDRYFEPTFVKAAAGQTLAISLDNVGELPHTFTIPSLNVDQTLQPGDKMTVNVTLGQSDVAYYCRFHVASGMWGSFYLGSSPTATPPAS